MLGPKLQRHLFAGLASLLMSAVFVGSTIMPMSADQSNANAEMSIHA